MTIPSYASGLLFTKAHGLVRQRIYTVLESYKLNPTSWSVLGVIAATPDGTRLASVADKVGMTPPMITVVAGDLLKRGYIKRIPHHTDGRAKLLIITPAGKHVSSEIEQKLRTEIQGLLQGATTAQITAFQKVLETIIANAA